MWNGAKVTPLGTCHLSVTNPQSECTYNNVEFLVVRHHAPVPLLGLNTAVSMKMISVHEENFDQVLSVSVTKQFSDVFVVILENCLANIT